ncbi:LPS translocon maturation chaperone LptM [Rhodopseudomonas palustris]|uniref:Lipoprotein n=1 Tax=Rhodopseudomonas palustris (strain BisB18) TaxID=316056 RepID=Q20WU0_RHOPB
MNRLIRPSWAVLALTLAALTLAGCGRKSGLDLPPGASAQVAPTPDPVAGSEPAAQSGLFDQSASSSAPPVAAKGRKKPFILDPLLND